MDLRGSWREDQGSALIAVIGIMTVLAVLAVGAFWMADDSLFQSKRDRASVQALSVAEAGLDQALWRLKSGNAPTSTLVLDLPTGKCSVISTKTTGFTWRLIASGSSNTTPVVTRTISTNVFAMSLWDMVFAGKESAVGGNGHINGNATYHGSWYMKGDFPSNLGDAKFEGGPFFVKDGNIAMGASATMGEAGKVDLYCNGTIDPNHINATFHADVPDLETPDQAGPQLAVARSTAIAESTDNLQGATGTTSEENDETRASGDTTGLPSPRSGFYKVVDNDGVVNKSVTSVTIGQGQPSFGRPYDPSIGHSKDDFAWDAAAGVLTVQGTVFVDAVDLNITGAKFAGKGTIVCSGDVHLTNQWEAVSLPDYPVVHCVGISATGMVTEDVARCYGPFYSDTSFEMLYNNNGYFNGAVVAPDVTFGMHADVWVTPTMSANMPPSMPMGVGQIVVSTGWHEGVN